MSHEKIKNKIYNVFEATNYLKLPQTKILYEGLGVPEPQAWKHLICSTLPLGIFLLPSVFLPTYEGIPAIAQYDNTLNTVIGIAFVIGAAMILWAWWWPSDTMTQSERVLKEISGHILISGGFLAIGLLGAPYFPTALFTFFISCGCGMGSLARGISLMKKHYLFVAVDEEVERQNGTD